MRTAAGHRCPKLTLSQRPEGFYKAITKLDKALRREIRVGRRAYIVTLGPLGMKLVVKGKRKGVELVWNDLVSGDAALATALNVSLKRAR